MEHQFNYLCMTIIKRKLIKNFIYSRKTTNKSIDLESLGLNTVKGDLDEKISQMINIYLSKLNIEEFARILRYANKMSKAIILAPSQIEYNLEIILYDVFKNYYLSKELGLYRGEYFSVLLTTNKNNKHILVLLPNVDLT